MCPPIGEVVRFIAAGFDDYPKADSEFVPGPITRDAVGKPVELNDADGWRACGRTKPGGATAVGFYNAPVRMDMLGEVIMGAPNRDNWLLTDERLALEEIGRFRDLGGRTIVDVTSVGLKRDPQALRRAAEASGLNVMMGCGWYCKSWHPAGMDKETVDSLTEQIVRDITVGADGTGIRAGIIGEIGTKGHKVMVGNPARAFAFVAPRP